jgi:hypothetical protein
MSGMEVDSSFVSHPDVVARKYDQSGCLLRASSSAAIVAFSTSYNVPVLSPVVPTQQA